MRVSWTERSNFSGSSAKPGAITYISSGMAIWATAVKTQQPGEHHRIDVLRRKRLAFASPPAFEALGEQRHEGRIEGAFGKQRAEQVGKAEGDDEGLRDRPGADAEGDQHVADETQDAAHQRIAADRRCRFEKGHAFAF